MVIDKNILKDIILKMNYDTSKTLSENTLYLNEQSMGGVMSPTLVSSDLGSSQKPSSNPNKYPNYCKYPNKAIFPSPIPGSPLKGNELLIKGFCYYPAPSNTQRGGTAGIWIPQESEITFWTSDYLTKAIEHKIKVRNEGESMWSGKTDQEITKILTENLPLGTVAKFDVYGVAVASYMQRKGGYDISDYTFKGFYYVDTKYPYEQPELEDTRNDWDKFWDEWGTIVQIGSAIGFAVISVATGGIGGMALLAIEIGVEGTLGGIMAQRAWEKTEDPAQVGFELLFGLTPMLKLNKFVKGVSSAELETMISKMEQAGLNAKSTKEEVEAFYKTLTTDADKEILSRMLLDTSNELTEAELKELMGKQLVEEVYDYVKKNPDLLKSVEWYKKVWAKEGMANGFILLLDMVYSTFFQEKLSDEKKREMMGIITTIPDSLKEHFATQVLKDPENAKKLVENAGVFSQKLAEGYKNVGENVKEQVAIALREKAVQDSLSAIGVTYAPIKRKVYNTAPEGYVKLTDDEFISKSNLIIDFIDVNGESYYLLENPESSGTSDSTNTK